MTSNRIVYLNYAQVASGHIEGIQLPRDYALACRFLHCSILDRTRTLDPGFDYAVLDPLPVLTLGGPSFDDLCDTIGQEIVAEAIKDQREIHVLWSGGIDSTSALIAVLKAARANDWINKVAVVLTVESVQEYPRFFLEHIAGCLRLRSARAPIASCVDRRALTITGEHGDQLFGSHLLRSYVQRGFGAVKYRDVITAVLIERLHSIRSAHRVRRYLQPVIDAAPIPIITLFDYFWWLNFSLKWQEVSLRLCAFGGDAALDLQNASQHFFRDSRFQSWALDRGASRCPSSWDRYKDEAKRYIRDFTGDEDYYRSKQKEDSLKNVMQRSDFDEPIAVLMHEDFRPVLQPMGPTTHA